MTDRRFKKMQKKFKFCLIGLMAILTANGSVTAFANNDQNMAENVVLQEMDSSVELGIPTDITITSGGNLVLKIEWKPGEIVGTTADQVRYLVYRSDTYEGEYKNIGYTPYNTNFYYDGGGENALEAGKTYYYKIQAYAPENGGASSNLYECEPGNGVALEESIGSNEFFTQEDMIAHLRAGLKAREEEIEMLLWVPEYISGYHKVLYEKAVEEKEDLSADSSLGDYFSFHILNYDADLQDMRIQQNGLKKYRLVYWPQYYTTKEEEDLVEEEVQRLVDGGLEINSSATDIEKVEAVYRYLAANSTYDLSLRNGEERCSAYDALIQHKAVCQGFANASYKLLRELGIMNRIVTGEVYYDNAWRVHAWNLVLIDGAWYHLDATTEVHFVEQYGYVSYKWFLKNDRDLGNIFRKDAENFNEEFETAHPTGAESILIPLQDIPSLTAEGISSTTIKVGWNKVLRATGYELYRADQIDGEYILIKDIPGYETADKDITKGKKYYYKVRAYEQINDKKVYSEFSEVQSAIALETPILSSTSFTMKPDSIELDWQESAGADGYDVYRSEKNNENYSKIAEEIQDSAYADYNVSEETKYYYKVQPYYKSGEKLVYGSYSNEKYVTTEKRMIKPDAVPSSGVTVKISWEKIDGVNAYEIYRSNSANGEYKYIKTTTGTSTSDTNLTAGQRYYYKITAYKEMNGIKRYLLFSNEAAVVALATPTLSELTTTETGILLNWTKASGADRYNVYRSDSKGGDYKYIESVLGGQLTYEDKDVEEGKTYYYKIRAYKRVDGVVYYGGYSGNEGMTLLDTPKLEASPSSGVTMKLKWDKVDGAYAYEIYRSTGTADNYTYVKTTTGTSTSDTKLTAGTRYYYQIRAYKEKDGRTNYSKYKSDVAVTLATPTLSELTTTETGILLNWTKASGADRYNVYRSESRDGDYRYIESVLGGQLTYEDKDVEEGKTYYYKIRAYKRVDGVVYYGGYSKEAFIKK